MELEASYRGRSLRGWLSHSRVARGETQPGDSEEIGQMDGRSLGKITREREALPSERNGLRRFERFTLGDDC